METPSTSAEPTSQPDKHLVSREEWQASMASRNAIANMTGGNILPPVTIANFDQTLPVPSASAVRILQGEALINKLESEGEDLVQSIRLTKRLNNLYTDFMRLPEKEREQRIAGMDYGEQFLTHELAMGDSVLKEYALGDDLEAEFADFQAKYPEFKKEFTAGFNAGVEGGYIPPEVSGRLDDALDKTAVGIIDKNLIDALIHGAEAMYIPGQDKALVGHAPKAYKFKKLPMRYHVGHELVHKLSGGTFVSRPDGTIARTRIGFSNESPNDDAKAKMSKNCIDEAIIEHINVSILGGNFDTLDPDERNEYDPRREIERKLMAVWIGKSGGIIDLKAVTRSIFEDSGDEIKTSDRRIFVGQSVTSYGPGALNTLNQLCEMSLSLTYEEVKEHIVPRIHGPERDEQGNVVKTGYIDMPDLSDILKIADAAGNKV